MMLVPPPEIFRVTSDATRFAAAERSRRGCLVIVAVAVMRFGANDRLISFAMLAVADADAAKL